MEIDEKEGGRIITPSGIITPRGYVDIKVFNRNKEVVQEIKHHNLIMKAGLTRIAAALTTNTVLTLSHIAYGASGAIPSQMDTKLIEEEGREEIFAKTARNGKAIFGTYFGFEHSASNDVREFGLFSGGTEAPDSGILFARSTISDRIKKTTDMAFSITWTIEFLVGDVS